MEKEYNLSTSQSNTENTDPKSVGPSTDELKNRFKEGSIPLQTDYSDLIDIADIGRRAMGKAPDQTENPNSGLELNNNSGLLVKTNPTGGLKADKDGLSVKLKDKSLLTDASGLAVNTGRGLWINNDKLEVDNHDGIEIVNEGVKVKASNGINVDGNGVSVRSKDSTINVGPDGISVGIGWGIKAGGAGLDVKASNGINVDGYGVYVKPKDNGGISVDKDGVSVKCWDNGGITVTDGSGLYLKLAGGNSGNSWNGVSGLSLGSDGVKVKAGNGINVDGNGVSVKAKDKTINVDPTGISVRLGWGIKIGDGLDVKAGNGITADGNGVSVRSKDNTISVDPTGISVNLGWGVKVGGGLDVKASNGINVDSNGVSVKAKSGSGIKVDSDGVSVDINSIISALSDLIIPPGTIVPFYNNGSLPNGWVWCDGSNGTPDLNNKLYNLNLVSGWSEISETAIGLSTGDHPRIYVAYARYIMKK
ncbi:MULTISPECIES: hypothetical protein [Photorhabdus]|uniref:Tail fiber protein n=1 Tax=Photorhabdus luminescens TaxID=29488 RepID=A0A1G5QAV3_PHOLU|nr:hypothetical protein [Photorhabdus luminescens]SCZ58792.1 hypothetical protein SAMN02982990_01366 [Photorhabdus luminescens]